MGTTFAQETYTQEAGVYALGRYGKKMANGDYLGSRQRTCSHDFLPVGSLIEVTNLANKRSEVVQVNGKSQSFPIELTHSVAHDLGLLGSSQATVKIVVIRRTAETINPMPAAEHSKKRANPIMNQSEIPKNEPTKTGIKKQTEFPTEFPKHSPIRYDTVTRKLIIKENN